MNYQVNKNVVKHIDIFHSSSTKENVVEGMKDIISDAQAWTGMLPGQSGSKRKMVMIVLTNPYDEKTSIAGNLKILKEGG